MNIVFCTRKPLRLLNLFQIDIVLKKLNCQNSINTKSTKVLVAIEIG